MWGPPYFMVYPCWAPNVDFHVLGDVVSAFGCHPRLQLFDFFGRMHGLFTLLSIAFDGGFFFCLFVKCYWYWFSSVGGREEKPTCITSHNISTACDLGHIQTHPYCNSVHDCPLWILTAFLLAFVWVHYQVCEWEVSQLVEINEGILQYHAFGCCGRSKFLFFILLYQQSGIQLNSIQYIFLLFNRKKMWNLIQ